MAKRKDGGSSPRKEQLYQQHFSKCYKNKLRRLKKFYRLTFKNSKAQKERHMKLPEKQRPRKKYFCDKFPNEKSFISKIKIKRPSIGA